MLGPVVDLSGRRKQFTLIFGGILQDPAQSVRREGNCFVLGSQLHVGSLTLSGSFLSSFLCRVLEEKVTLEGQEWDSISAALAHCELYTPLVKFSAFSVFFFFKPE